MSIPLQFLPGQGLLHSYSIPPICVVGEELVKGVKAWPEGTIFDYTAGRCHLLLNYRNPADCEKKAFSDPVRFALFFKYNTIVLLFKFGAMPWQDAPYSYWLVPEEGRPDPEADLNKPGNRLFVHCFLINAANGILEGLRALTFSPDFTTHLLQSVREQAQTLSSIEKHSRTVSLIYSQYPTPKAMVKDALVQCWGGD